MLQPVRLDHPGPFLDATVTGIEGLADAGIGHSDLSPFNLLVHENRPWFIDLAADMRVDRLGSPPWIRPNEAMQVLGCGAESVRRYVRRYGLELDTASLVDRVRATTDLFRVA